MIPRKIHYCWYGGKEIPAEYQRYIYDWKVKNPDYEIIRWDETNSPMHLPYMENALKHKKWANLSNFMRLHVLYREGGIYLDTDIEVLKSFDGLLSNTCFVGFESGAREGEKLLINNAVLGAVPGHPFIKKCKDYLLNNFDGAERPPDSSPVMTTKILRELGVNFYGNQVAEDVRIYPVEYFYPVEYKKNDTVRITADSYTIHHWAATWKENKRKKPFLLAIWQSASYRIIKAAQKIFLSTDG